MKSDTMKDKLLFSSLKRSVLLLAIIGTVAIVISFLWNAMQDRRFLIESARIQARSAFEKDVVYRRWNAGHGGVYVPVTDKTPPNPYLSDLPERDITTTNGTRLTLMNPAYMTRQIHELGEEAYNVRSHITSLNPIRPENAADPWETEALKAFESGSMEISSIEQIDGVAYMRLMRPLFTEERCLKCHAKQGHKEGDIRGGISVSIPMKPLWAAMHMHQRTLLLIHALLWLISMGVLYWGLVWFGRSERKRTQAIEALEESAYFLKESQRVAHLGYYVFDITTGLWTSSDFLNYIFGIEDDYRRDIDGWLAIVHPEQREEMLTYLANTVLTEHQSFNREYRIIRLSDSEERWVHGLGELEFDENGNPVKMIGTVQDITERKQATQALKESEEKYRSFFEYDLTGDYISTPDGKLIDCNQAFLDIFGYQSLEEAKSKNLKLLYLSHSERKKMVDKVKKERVITNYEHEVRKVTGEAIFINQNTFGEFDENNKLVRMRGYIIDVTERKKAEEKLKKAVDLDIRKAEKLEMSYAELKQSQNSAINLLEDLTIEIAERKKTEEELRASREYAQNLINSSLDMIIAVDKRRRVTEFNQAAEKTFGYQKEEVLGEHIDMLYADAEVGLKVHKSTIEKGQHVEEIWNRRKNGKVFLSLLSASSLRNVDGEVVGVMGVSRDITQQKAVEQSLLESEEKFRRVIEQSNDGIYVLQGNRFVFTNPRFTEITGFELKEISAEDFNFMELVAEEGLKVLKDREAMRKRGEEPPSRYVFKSLRKDGGKRDLEVSVTRVEWKGAPATLGVLRDVTERIQTRTKLEQALEKAKEGERVKSLFLANMSHEIRTPLNTILGFTELIESSASHLINEEEKVFFDMIRNSGTRLIQTVHEILDISQIEAGTYDLKIEQLELVKLVKDLVNGFQPMAHKKGLRMEYESNVDTAFIKADQYGVSQAICNIIDNAIKYTDQGEINVSLEQKSKRYILSIRDTGIGIAEEYQDSLYDAFSQESEGYTKKFQGIGLGMAITKRHLDMNRVALDVESTKGVGTTFKLTFNPVKKPVHKKKIQKEEAKILPVSESVDKPLVLLVEDDSNSRTLIEFFLKGQYNICFAASVAGAKQQLKKHAVDLILLDLSLEGNEDGLDLVRWMRKTKTWRKTPVIANTAHAFTKDQDNCLAAGCNDYLPKPIKREKLLEKIGEYVL